MPKPAPTHSTIARTVKSTRWVVLLGLGLGAVQWTLGLTLLDHQYEEARVLIGLGFSVCLVTLGWAFLLWLSTMRMALRLDSNLNWLAWVIAIIAAWLCWVDVGLAILLIGPPVLLICACNFTILHVKKLEKRAAPIDPWSEEKRIEAGRPYFRWLSVILILLLIPGPVYWICAKSAEPIWHQSVLRGLPQPLRDWTYLHAANAENQYRLLASQSLSEELLIELIHSRFPEAVTPYCFDSLSQLNPKAALEEARHALRAQGPYQKWANELPGGYDAYLDKYQNNLVLMIKFAGQQKDVELAREFVGNRDSAPTVLFYCILAELKPPSIESLWLELYRRLTSDHSGQIMRIFSKVASESQIERMFSAVFKYGTQEAKREAISALQNEWQHLNAQTILLDGLKTEDAELRYQLIYTSTVCRVGLKSPLSQVLIKLLDDPHPKAQRLLMEYFRCSLNPPKRAIRYESDLITPLTLVEKASLEAVKIQLAAYQASIAQPTSSPISVAIPAIDDEFDH